MYINIYGCDKYPSDYIVINAEDTRENQWGHLTYERYGTMYMPVCHSPKGVVAIRLFLFF